MTEDRPGDVTRLLLAWREGSEVAAEDLLPLIYDELHRIAGRLMRGERREHTLQATALVNEAYLRLVGVDVPWQDRAHFYAVAARAMRRLLVDHARLKRAGKRGGDAAQVSLDDALAVPAESAVDMVDLDRALSELTDASPRRARAVELHFFTGLTHEEIARVLDVSVSTVRGDLRFSRAWLSRRLDGEA